MSDEIKEVSKAVAEASKFGTKALDVTEKMGRFVSKVFGESIEISVGMLGDKLKFLRWQRQVRLVDRVNEILESRGITETLRVPPQYALPILENASLEEEDDLQDLWATLLANAMDPNITTELRYAFIDVLKNLTPLDATILSLMFEIRMTCEKNKDSLHLITDPVLNKQVSHYKTTQTVSRGLILQSIFMDDWNYEVSISNLYRLECLTGRDLSLLSHSVDITPFGVEFVKACSS